jgi:hypothetical protein
MQIISKALLGAALPVMELGAGLTPASVEESLDELRKMNRLRNAKALVFLLSTESGSLVQASLLRRHIARACKKHHLPAYGLVEQCSALTYTALLGCDRIFCTGSSRFALRKASLAQLDGAGVLAKAGLEVVHMGGRVLPEIEVGRVTVQLTDSMNRDIAQARAGKLQLTGQQLNAGGYLTGQEIVQAGLCDEVSSLEQIAGGARIEFTSSLPEKIVGEVLQRMRRYA